MKLIDPKAQIQLMMIKLPTLFLEKPSFNIACSLSNQIVTAHSPCTHILYFLLYTSIDPNLKYGGWCGRSRHTFIISSFINTSSTLRPPPSNVFFRITKCSTCKIACLEMWPTQLEMSGCANMLSKLKIFRIILQSLGNLL